LVRLPQKHEERSIHERDVRMAANLYLPPGFNASGKYAAIVVVHPVIIDGATHMDLYAGARVGPVTQLLSQVFKQNLGV
jgi:hypothetical protein